MDEYIVSAVGERLSVSHAPEPDVRLVADALVGPSQSMQFKLETGVPDEATVKLEQPALLVAPVPNELAALGHAVLPPPALTSVPPGQ